MIDYKKIWGNMELIKEGYKRVTEILSIYQSYAFVPLEKLKKAQDVGTEIHWAIEGFLKGEFRIVDPKNRGYLDSFLEWRKGVFIDPLVIEERFYCDSMKITGQLDLLCNLGTKVTLVDFKTGSWAHPEIWRLQGAFYSHLLQVNNQPVPDSVLFLQLKKEGTYPTLFEFQIEKRDYEMCECAYKSYNYFKNPPVVADGLNTRELCQEILAMGGNSSN